MVNSETMNIGAVYVHSAMISLSFSPTTLVGCHQNVDPRDESGLCDGKHFIDKVTGSGKMLIV